MNKPIRPWGMSLIVFDINLVAALANHGFLRILLAFVSGCAFVRFFDAVVGNWREGKP